jgi:hypothetical protein
MSKPTDTDIAEAIRRGNDQEARIAEAVRQMNERTRREHEARREATRPLRGGQD